MKTLMFEAFGFTVMAIAIGSFFTDFLKAIAAKIPQLLWNWVIQNITVSIAFKKGDEIYLLIQEWMLKNPYAQKARNKRVLYSPSQQKVLLVPGIGNHWLWYRGRPMMIMVSVSKASGKDGEGMTLFQNEEETITVTILGRSHHLLEKLLDELVALRKTEESKLSIAVWKSYYWSFLPPSRKRDMSTIYMDETQRKDLLDTVRRFLKSEKWYTVRGIPWRMGIILDGPPGTGKTTLAKGLAGYFNRPICILNLATMGSDNALMEAFSAAPNDAIILLEDADAFKIALARKEAKKKKHGTPITNFSSATAMVPDDDDDVTEIEDEDDEDESTGKQQPLSISGLLNAIDGVASPEGRILIMTTNHYEKLDSALIRSGRVDKRVTIRELPADSVVSMFKIFFPDHAEYESLVKSYADDTVKACAWWQEQFIKYMDDPQYMFKLMMDRVDLSSHIKEVAL